MKAIAISDIHGHLPEITKQADILCIAGDFSPLKAQRNAPQMLSWTKKKFMPWIDSLPVGHVILVAGNHDFVMQNSVHEPQMMEIFNQNEKLIYLEDRTISLEGKIIYGSPWVIGPAGWAFYDRELIKTTNTMPWDADLCIFHQPLHDQGNGTVMIPPSWELDALYPDFGSVALDHLCYTRKPKMVVTGHVHTGNHSICEMENIGGGTVKFANVSMLNEDYEPFYEPLEFEI